MTTETLTLSDFLLARISEDEARASAVPSPVTTGSRLDTLTGRARAAFVAQWQPARVLAECEAKRAVLADPLLHTFMGGEGISVAGARIARALAAVYADHRDFREEWRP